MKILIVTEDFRNEQYLLKPLFKSLLRSLDRPRARILVCRDPLLGGVGEALKLSRLSDIVERYRGMTDVFILCVDRDGIEGRRERLEQIESALQDHQVFLAENAWEEIETWALAGLELPTQWKWNDVRAEINVKEMYFDKLARSRGVADHPGGGRGILGEEAARRISAIRSKCREDFDRLAQRLEAIIPNG